MQSPRSIVLLAGSCLALVALPMSGCDKKPAANAPAAGASADHGHDHADAPAKADDHGHDHGPAGEHGSSMAGHGGPVIALGEQTIGAFSAKATRDQGEIVAGKDAPIDVTITSAAGAQAVAVRLWIGGESAAGSVKAKAEVENPKEPNRWHVHAEIPSPLPADSKLWVEIEDEKGGVSVGSFDLKI